MAAKDGPALELLGGEANGLALSFEEIGDPVRRYAMRPDAACTIDEWTYRISSHRTRGEDFPAEKPDGEKRLLCLGDSYAFGLWSDEDETLVGHLARRANEAERERASGTTWRAVNCGVPGYHAGQQALACSATGSPETVRLSAASVPGVTARWCAAVARCAAAA